MSTEAHEAVWKRVKDQDATIAALRAEVERLKNDRDNLFEVADIWHQERHQALRDRDRYKAESERWAGMWQELKAWVELRSRLLTRQGDKAYEVGDTSHEDYCNGTVSALNSIANEMERIERCKGEK